MRVRHLPLLLAGLAAGLLALRSPLPPATAGDGDALAPGVEVLARGPVHEAFAEPTGLTPTPGPVVTHEPPSAIEEAPPEEKPEGDNVAWIPGYWGWDEEASNFVWVSGFWRAVPHGRTWVPGSWQRGAGGWRWVAGYWGVAEQEETVYLPPPPPPLEATPSTPAPGPDYSYVPGIWVYQVNRYVWRPGYWLAFRPGWVWVPACYRWTPCGYVFVPGFWDLPLLTRGLLFAPVRFPTAVYLRPGFVYRPIYCVQPDFLCGALFVHSRVPCYYFGDYFAARYQTRFTPWVNYRFARGVGADLNFCYYRHAYRDNPLWERGLAGLYAGRYAGTIPPPPRTLVQQTTVVNNIVNNKITNVVVSKNVNITHLQNVNVLTPVKKVDKLNVTALSSLAGATPTAAKTPPLIRPIRIEKLSPADLQRERKEAARFQAIARERRETEAKLVPKAPLGPTATPLRTRFELPRTEPPRGKRPTDSPTPPPPKTELRPQIRPGVPLTKPPVTTPPVTRPKPKDLEPPKTVPMPKPKAKEPPKATTPPPPKTTTPPPPKATTTPPPSKTTTPPPPKATTPPPPKTTTPPPPKATTPPPPKPKDKKPDKP